MAHAFFARAGGAVRSAGTRPSPELHPNVIEAMGEIGIDLGGASPHGFERGDAEWADIVVTMGCGDECPVVAGACYRDWPIDDPIGLSIEETRPIRDEIARRVAALVAELRVESSGYLSDGFAERYDAYRPRPPAALRSGQRYRALDRGVGFAGRTRRRRRAEPADARCRRGAGAVHVAYVRAQAAETGLDGGTADVVTASQSFHWMAPDPTLAEVARVLRAGGVFCTYDYDWPPVIHPDIDAAFEAVIRKLGNRGRARKVEHVQRMRESGRFRYVRRIDLHSTEEGDAERVAGTAWTMGPVANRLLAGEITEEEVGLTRLREVALEVLGDRRVPFLFTYHAVLGVR